MTTGVGLAFTIVFGLVVVYAFHGIHIHAGSGRTRGIADIVGGVVALAFALALVTGHVHKSDAREAPEGGGRIKTILDGRLTQTAADRPRRAGRMTGG